ncbi:tetratricopeptide repeat protein [Planctomycetota bacterium]
MSDSMKTTLQFMEQSPQRSLPRLEIDPTGGKQAGVDYTDALNRVAQEAQQQTAGAANSSSTLILDDVSFQLLSVSSTFGGIETPTDRKINQAKDLITQEKYADALTLVVEVLAEQPGHHEAAFLAATCEHGLERHEQSLQRLFRLRTSGATSAMAGRIRRLCEKIREVMRPGVFEEAQQTMAQGQVEQAINRVRGLVKLDPDAAMYHYLLTIIFLMTGSEQEAYRSIETAVAVGQPQEKARLLALQNDIRERIAVQRMAPAAGLFKQGKFREARQYLRTLDKEAQQAKLWSHFDAFLAQCAAGKRNDPPALDYSDVEPLYEFILSEELPAIRRAMVLGKAEVAERTAKLAVGWLPHYYYVHFLYANSIYCRLGDELTSESLPSLNQLLKGLRTAVKHATQAYKDPEIKGAPALKEAMQELVDHFEEQEREAAIVNPVIQEFVTVMESSKTSIGSLSDLRRARSGLQAVKRKIPNARQKARSQPAQEALTDLAEAIDGNLAQLAKIEKEIGESEVVGKLVEQFNELMEGLERSRGVKSVAELRRVESKLRSIQNEIPQARRQVKSQRSKDSLKDLENAVNRHLAEVKKASTAVGDGEIVGPLVQQFNFVMESLEKSGGIRSYDQAATLRKTMQSLKSDCQSKRHKVNSTDARKNIDDLTKAIDAVLGQLPGF